MRRILLVSGSTRSGSTNTAAIRTFGAAASAAGIEAALFEGLARLPAFNPDDDHEPLHPAVHELRQEIARSDAVLFCTPEYAGALPGSFKNLLDWTVGGAELYGRPVAWINVAPEGRGTNAEASLATVLRYVGGDVIEPACMRLPLARDAVGPDGLVDDVEFRRRLDELLETIRHHVDARRR